MAKFGAMNTLWPSRGAAASAARTWSSFSSVQPVVPTTTSTPCLTRASTLPSDTLGTVNSTTTSVFSGGDGGQVVTCVEREREFGVGGGIDGVDHMRAHTAFGADYGNLDHCSSLMFSRTRMLRMSYVCRAHVFEIACPRP